MVAKLTESGQHLFANNCFDHKLCAFIPESESESGKFFIGVLLDD